MATVDLSRSAFDPRKRYDSLRMQLGTVLTDDDFNENERIDHEDRRRARVEIVGPAGSPDDGFRIDNLRVNANGDVDFDILPGSFYLGGHRLEQVATETFRAQRDWLQGPVKGTHKAPAAARNDLAVLMIHQQPVRAVEDGELFEVALGGPETAARIRTTQRVVLVEDVEAETCDEAWQQVLGQWDASGQGALSDEHELVPDVRLTVTFDPGGQADDLCTPLVAGGYLGAENQAIRVQLVDGTHLTWGFDNGSPLYRVKVAADRKTLTLVTEPRDQAHWPLAEQTVEILPWAAVLPNNEKVAEGTGHLSRLQSSYNPDTRQLTLTTAIPTAGFDDWQSRPDAATLDDTGVYYYLRVWHRGADLTSDPAIAFTPGTALALGQTGLRVTIAGSDRRAGDYWIIAARPETPNRVVPWELEAGRRPHGVRRFVAPLALIQWQVANGQLAGTETQDCRPGFDPLTRRTGCCTVTVGDGVTSRGNVDSVEDAIARLPAGGGTICLLPGLHETNAEIAGRRDVRISGCAGRTRVVPRPEALTDPIFRIVDSRTVTLEHLDLISLAGSAIVAEGTKPGGLRDLTIEHNRLATGQTAIDVRGGLGVTIADNTIRLFDREGAGPAIQLQAEDGLVKCNDIGVVPRGDKPPDDETPPRNGETPDPADPCGDAKVFHEDKATLTSYVTYYWTAAFDTAAELPRFTALGGIEVEAGSERVTIVDNRIRGGAGNGITLGSALNEEEIKELIERQRRAVNEREVEGEQHTFEHPGERLVGEVVDENGPVADLVVVLTEDRTGSSRSLSTDDDGRFIDISTEKGSYRIAIQSPGYRIIKITFDEERWVHVITVERVDEEPDPDDSFAFLYDIQIERNTIVAMGLSGVGVPRAALTGGDDGGGRLSRLRAAGGLGLFAALLGSYVVGLRIDHNQITGCLQNPFDGQLRAVARSTGLGGISLGVCEDVLIRWNRIERNGRRHLDPVCGIFVFFTEDADVTHNRVIENGPLVDAEGDLTPGVRGGIVLARVASFSPAANLFRASARRFVDSGRPAARVHDNVVDQPAGRALEIRAVGPLSVLNNQFTTDLATADRRQIATRASTVGGATASGGRAATVLIHNLGRPIGGGIDDGFARPDGSFTTETVVNRRARRVSAASAAVASVGLPSGSVLFNDNQIRLGAGEDLCSVLIVSMDDVGFDGNQCTVMPAAQVVVGSCLIGATVRGSDSRLAEAPRQAQASLLTLSLAMNATTNNQGNHCIFALNGDASRPPVDFGNQALFVSGGECAEIGGTLNGQLPKLLRTLAGELVQ